MTSQWMHQAAIYCIPHTNSVICNPSAQKTTSPHKASEVDHAQANTEITISMLASKSDTQASITVQILSRKFLDTSIHCYKIQQWSCTPHGSSWYRRKIPTHNGCKNKAIIQAPHNHINPKWGGKDTVTRPIPPGWLWWHWWWRYSQVIGFLPPSHLALYRKEII